MVASAKLPCIPTLGVTIEVLLHLNDLATSNPTLSSGDQPPTTKQVCDLVVKPLTQDTKQSYVNWLVNQHPTRSDVGKATVFVSHAWEHPFCDLVHMLQEFQEEQGQAAAAGGEQQQAMYWLDLVTINQHDAEIGAQPRDWWTSTFTDHLASIGSTVVLMRSLQQPVVTTRSWCLWEIHSTHMSNSKLAVFLPKAERAKIVGEFASVFQRTVEELCDVDLHKTQASRSHDQEQILDAARSMRMGVHGLNGDVGNYLRRWVTEVARQEILAAISKRDETHELALLAEQVGVMLREQGNLSESEALLCRALITFQRTTGHDHPHTASCLHNLGHTLSNQARYDEAEVLYRRSLAIKERSLGLEHVDSVLTLEHIANLLYKQGKYQEAEGTYRCLLAIQGKPADPNHPILACMAPSEKTSPTTTQRKCEKAKSENHEDRAVLAGTRPITVGHPLCTAPSNSLANLRSAHQDKQRRLLPLLRNAMIRDKPDRTDSTTSLIELANLLRSQGSHCEAEALYRRAVAVREKTFGPTHSLTSSALNNLACSLTDQSKFADAEVVFRKGLLAQEKCKECDHIVTATLLSNLANCLISEGKLDESLAVHFRALTIRERIHDSDHPDFAVALHSLAITLFLKGKYDESQSVLWRAVEMFQKTRGADHAQTVESRNLLALVMEKQTDYNDDNESLHSCNLNDPAEKPVTAIAVEAVEIRKAEVASEYCNKPCCIM